MSTKGFSRRDLLRLGGNVVLTVGAAKIVVTLPGCSFSGGNGIDAPPAPIDAPVTPIDAYEYYGGYTTLDDCHKIGTYHYRIAYPPYYTYHSYWTGAYGCPGHVYSPPNVRCYPDYPDFAPGYPYFCFTYYYTTITSP